MVVAGQHQHAAMLGGAREIAVPERVTAAIDGERGLELARAKTPELIVCDIHLPGMDGYEVARRLKADAATRHVPLVGVTALAMVGDRDKVLAAGFDGYIAKPIAPRTFVAQVLRFLPAASQPVKEISADLSAQPPLPAALSAPFALQPQATTPPTDTRGSIVALDNVESNLTMLRQILEPLGFAVKTATSIDAALALARSTPPSLFVSDVHMGEEHGFAFMRKVKADARLAAIPFVFISASMLGDAEERAALGLGATRFIHRPIASEQLAREILACLPMQKAGAAVAVR